MKTSASRRRFLLSLAGAATGLALSPLRAARVAAYPNASAEPREAIARFALAQLRYAGGDWDPHPSAHAAFV